MIRQTRIFAPFNAAYPTEHWYENILGRIIKPMTQNREILHWFWFSRYIEGINNNSNYNAALVTENYLNNGWTHSVMFRYSIDDNVPQAFENEFRAAALAAGCLITNFLDWDKVGDVGTGRHIGGILTEERQERRAERNTRLYHQISLLALDVLDIPDVNNNYSWEVNNANDIPNPKSSFHTPHHLFCNITQTPLTAQVKVWNNNGTISVRTETSWGSPGYFGDQSTSNDPPSLDVNMPTNF